MRRKTLKKAEAFCTVCEWRGDGTGLVACPICSQPITTLDVDEDVVSKNEEYPDEVLKDAKEDDF